MLDDRANRVRRIVNLDEVGNQEQRVVNLDEVGNQDQRVVNLDAVGNQEPLYNPQVEEFVDIDDDEVIFRDGIPSDVLSQEHQQVR